MLKKVNRLAKAGDIKKTLARGRTFFNQFFGIKFLPVAGTLRFTVVVSTKVYKSAVKRNRLKRVLREYLRRNLVSFAPGDYLISVKPRLNAQPENKRLVLFIEALNKIK